MKFLNSFFWKSTLGFILILAISLFLLWLSADPQSEEFLKQEQLAKDTEELYKNDIYGGETPEQTLQMFIDALKAGDTDLASKYFMVDKQKEWRNKLIESKEKNNIDGFVSVLESVDIKKEGKKLFDGNYQFIHPLQNEKLPWIIDLVLNPLTNKWKIESL